MVNDERPDDPMDLLADAITALSYEDGSTPPQRKRVLTQIEDELWNGVKPPSKRGGRVPKFYRKEVERIRADQRTLAEIAMAEGVSITTIMRVKQIGRYKNVPYIPRDEYDRSKAYTVRKMVEEANRGVERRRGRPFKSGRGPLTDEEKERIVFERRPYAEIAQAYGITVATVNRIKYEYNRQLYDNDAMHTAHKAMHEAIRKDPRHPQLIAQAYKVPGQVVLAIKRGDI